MSSDEKEKLNKVGDLETKLFSRGYESKIVHHDNFTYKPVDNIPDSWAKQDAIIKSKKISMRTSMFKKFFIFSIIFFLIAGVYAIYSFFYSGNTVSNNNIDISILGNTFTPGGEDLPLQIEITNKNNLALELADLIIEYPKESTSNKAGDTERIRQSLGTIPAGAIKEENIKIVLFGEQGSVKPVKISMEYRVEGSNSIFIKEKSYDVTISSTPINLTVDAPSETSPNQDINLKIKASLNANKPASKILLKVEYPLGFEFSSASPEPSFGNNVWNLGDLAPGAEQNISIFGKMIDVVDGEEKSFRVFSGSQSVVDKSIIGVVFNSLAQKVTIKRPSIEAKLYIDGAYGKEYTTTSKNVIIGSVRWVNNLDSQVNDFAVKVKLSGNALNQKTISSDQGFYNSNENTIIWDKNSVDEFTAVNPGQSGTLTFSMSSISLFSGVDGLLSDPSIKAEVSVSGQQASIGSNLKNVANSESKTIKVITDVGLTSKLTYFSGNIKNTGPIPPKVGKETTYTVSWNLSNTSNNVLNTEVKAKLPPWVRFTGKIFPAEEDVRFNPDTREVIWSVGKLSRGASIKSPVKAVSFQIAFTPSLSQLGSTPNIIGESVLTGHDDFANVNVRASRVALTTLLTNDADAPILNSEVEE